MKIRPEQTDRFREEMLERYVESMVPHLRKRCPIQTKPLDDDALRERIREGIAQAKEYGITDKVDVRRFLEYWARYEGQFGRSPASRWARPHLTNTDLNGSEKMNLVDDHYVFVIQLGEQS